MVILRRQQITYVVDLVCMEIEEKDRIKKCWKITYQTQELIRTASVAHLTKPARIDVIDIYQRITLKHELDCEKWVI